MVWTDDQQYKAINQWQKGKRIVLITKDKDKIKVAATAAGESLNAYILEAIRQRMEREEGKK